MLRVWTSRYSRERRNVQAIIESREVMRQQSRNNLVCHRGTAQRKSKSRMLGFFAESKKKDMLGEMQDGIL